MNEKWNRFKRKYHLRKEFDEQIAFFCDAVFMDINWSFDEGYLIFSLSFRSKENHFFYKVNFDGSSPIDGYVISTNYEFLPFFFSLFDDFLEQHFKQELIELYQIESKKD